MNRSVSVWGVDAKVFRPQRWLEEEIPVRAQQIQGHRHLLTFLDGPRTCLGKNFALTEFKVSLCFCVAEMLCTEQYTGDLVSAHPEL